MNYILIFNLESAANRPTFCNQLFFLDKINLELQQLPEARCWGEVIGKRGMKNLLGGKNCSIF